MRSLSEIKRMNNQPIPSPVVERAQAVINCNAGGTVISIVLVPVEGEPTFVGWDSNVGSDAALRSLYQSLLASDVPMGKVGTPYVYAEPGDELDRFVEDYLCQTKKCCKSGDLCSSFEPGSRLSIERTASYNSPFVSYVVRLGSRVLAEVDLTGESGESLAALDLALKYLQERVEG
jgi:hypothetical protein